ncbi:MAG: PH domain-containing protein [archaeon]|nr:PH domain-containing protein [archaeon]
MEEKEQVLKILRKTRKAYLPEYFCGVVILLMILLANTRGVAIPDVILYTGLFVGFFAVSFAELSRLVTRYKITNTKLVVIDGIIKQHKKTVYFGSLAYVPDLNVNQNRIGRILNYGSVYLRSAGVQESTFDIKDVNSPLKILSLIENLVAELRKH